MSTPAQLVALTRRCVHCGMCLTACPTYGIFGTEMDGPRSAAWLPLAGAAVRVMHLAELLDESYGYAAEADDGAH